MQKYDILFKQPNNSSDIIKKEDETILFREKTTQKTEKGEKKIEQAQHSIQPTPTSINHADIRLQFEKYK